MGERFDEVGNLGGSAVSRETSRAPDARRPCGAVERASRTCAGEAREGKAAEASPAVGRESTLARGTPGGHRALGAFTGVGRTSDSRGEQCPEGGPGRLG